MFGGLGKSVYLCTRFREGTPGQEKIEKKLLKNLVSPKIRRNFASAFGDEIFSPNSRTLKDLQ